MDTYQKCLCHVWWPQGLGVDFLALKLLGLSLQSSPCLVTSASRYPTSGFFSGCTCSTDPGYSEHISYMYIYIDYSNPHTEKFHVSPRGDFTVRHLFRE
jgi:hypothetical protein